MKILILNADLGYGGAEKSLAFVANSLQRFGHEIFFLTYRINNNNQTLNDGVKRIHMKLENGRHTFLRLPITCIKLHRFIKKQKFDAAISFLSPSNLRLVISCFFTHTKVLLSQRGDPYTSFSSKFIKNVNDFFFRKADYFVFQTKKAQDYYGKRISQKSTVIANPIKKLHRTTINTYDSKRIVTASRLDIRQKRQDILIKAFQIFNKSFPDYSLEIFGDGPDYSDILELISNDNNIKLMGKTSNIVEAIQDAEIFALTSDFEGIPNALLEAMSLGLPCVSTRFSPGGAELLIQDGVNGFLCECSDVDSLAYCFTLLASNKDLRIKIGNKALHVNDLYNENVIAEQWNNLFLKIASNSK